MKIHLKKLNRFFWVMIAHVYKCNISKFLILCFPSFHVRLVTKCSFGQIGNTLM